MNCATHNDVAAMAFCRTCGKPLCGACTRDVRGVIYCEPCLAARLDGTTPATGFTPVPDIFPPAGVGGPGPRIPTLSSGPNPTVAGILAGFFPFGVGAVYCSQFAKGLAHLVIFVLMVVGLSADLPWFVDMVLGLSLGFFYFYQIIDAVRTAKAVQLGQPVPDPFDLAQTFGGGSAGEKMDATKVPTGAVVLIGLGVLFLLHTVGLFEFGLHRFWPLLLIALGGWIFAKNWGLVDSNRRFCQCERCRTRKLMAPALLVTIGVLLLLDSAGSIEFHRTWPAILLVIGVVKLVQSNASPEGHSGPVPPFVTPSEPPDFPPSGPPSGSSPEASSSPEQSSSSSSSSSSGEVNHV